MDETQTLLPGINITRPAFLTNCAYDFMDLTVKDAVYNEEWTDSDLERPPYVSRMFAKPTGSFSGGRMILRVGWQENISSGNAV
ncbi:MAG: hypothetical protein R2744_02215 [Bacteroidales bacterium]